jgi:hypothetical protein
VAALLSLLVRRRTRNALHHMDQVVDMKVDSLGWLHRCYTLTCGQNMLKNPQTDERPPSVMVLEVHSAGSRNCFCLASLYSVDQLGDLPCHLQELDVAILLGRSQSIKESGRN